MKFLTPVKRHGTIPLVGFSEQNRPIPVAVISDGKPGHENQSLGISENLPNPDILLLKHNLKEGLPEAILRCQVRFLSGPKSNPEKFLRKIFTENEIRRLKDHNPKAIISAGTLSAGPCLVAGYLTGAVTCVCMRPSFLPLNMFDLAVIPEHDNPPDDPDILITLAAPNRVTPERLKTEMDTWSGEFPREDIKVISWIIGGPSSSAVFDNTHVLKGLERTLEWAGTNGWKVWLSTARRTPVELESQIENLAGKYSSLSWLLLWHRDQRNPLYAMFARSKLAIVTSDSVSMIAEAATAGKGPLVFRASKTCGCNITKQDRMVEGLFKAGYGSLAGDPESLNEILIKMLSGESNFPVLDDTQRASDKLLELIQGISR